METEDNNIMKLKRKKSKKWKRNIKTLEKKSVKKPTYRFSKCKFKVSLNLK